MPSRLLYYRCTCTARLPKGVNASTALAKLLERPAPGTTQPNLVAQMVGSLALKGKCFLGKFRSQGKLAQLALLPVDQIEVKIVAGGEPVYRYHHDPGSDGSGPMVTEHSTADVVHVRGLSLDGIRGASPIRYAREALGLASALAEQASAFVANGSAPKGVLIVPASPIQSDVMENLKSQWEARHGGSKHAGRVAVCPRK